MSAVVVLCLWWYLPRKLAKNFRLESAKEFADIEDAYRKTIGQAIAAVALIVSLYLTIQQYDLSRRSQQLDQYQKGFDALKGTDVSTHIGGIYALDTLAKSEPQWRFSILMGLSAAAVTFSSTDSGSKTDRRVAPDAEAALAIIAYADKPDSLYYHLANGRFLGARLSFANLIRADLREADLSGSDLYRANLFGANLTFAKLNGANLASVDFSHARLVSAQLCAGINTAVPHLQRIGTVSTQLADAKFYSAVLDYAKLHGADLKKSRFDDASMIGVSLIGAEMNEETSFRATKLHTADFSYSILKMVSFEAHKKNTGQYDENQRTILTNANFKNANLEGAKFHLADLRGASFENANLSNANFSGALTNEITFKGAHLCRTVMPNSMIRDDNCQSLWKETIYETLKCDHG